MFWTIVALVSMLVACLVSRYTVSIGTGRTRDYLAATVNGTVVGVLVNAVGVRIGVDRNLLLEPDFFTTYEFSLLAIAIAVSAITAVVAMRHKRTV